MFLIQWYPDQPNMAEFTSLTPTINFGSTTSAHVPCSIQPLSLHPQSLSFMFFSASLSSSFTLQPQTVTPFSRHLHPPVSICYHANAHCHKQLIFSIFQLYPTHCSHYRSLCPYNSHLILPQTAYLAPIQIDEHMIKLSLILMVYFYRNFI